MSDHSWVHVQIVLNIALRLLRLLVKGGRASRRWSPTTRCATATPRSWSPPGRCCTTSACRSTAPTTRPSASSSPSASCASCSPTSTRDPAERAVVIAESLHAIIGHRRRGEPYTVEAGVVRVADALDMAHGRSRLPVEAGQMGIHAISAAAIDRVEIAAGDERAGADRDRDEQLRRHLPGRRPAGDEAPRHAARRPRRGRRRGRGRGREAPADRVPDRRTIARRPTAQRTPPCTPVSF